MFWAPTATSGSSSARASRTAARQTNGGQITLVTPASRVREAIVRARSPASLGVVCIFQLAAITTSRMDAHHAGPALAVVWRRLGLGEPRQALEGPLHGGAVEVEPDRELGEGRLRRLATGVRDDADDVGLLPESAIGVEHR